MLIAPIHGCRQIPRTIKGVQNLMDIQLCFASQLLFCEIIITSCFSIGLMISFPIIWQSVTVTF